jgi:hypothetical protein
MQNEPVPFGPLIAIGWPGDAGAGLGNEVIRICD